MRSFRPRSGQRSSPSGSKWNGVVVAAELIKAAFDSKRSTFSPRAPPRQIHHLLKERVQQLAGTEGPNFSGPFINTRQPRVSS